MNKPAIIITICLFCILPAQTAEAHGFPGAGMIESISHKMTTPKLIRAVEKGDYEKVVKLLDKGADINARGEDKETALIAAVSGEKYKIASLLLDRGADVNAADKNGYTPLILISMSERGPEADALRERMLKMGADANARHVSGSTALHHAAEFHNTEAVKMLLKYGSEVDARDEDGATPLMFVDWPEPGLDDADGPYIQQAKQTAKLLLDKGADVNAKDNKGQTPLMGAARKASTKGVDYLLSHGAKLNEKDKDGRTVLARVRRCISEDASFMSDDFLKAFTALEKHLRKLGAKE